MATHHGTITEFSGNSDDWEAYIEQLENYFVANDIDSAAKKRAILLSSCGTAAYKTIRSILAPQKPTEVDYAELVKQVKQHYVPKPSEIIQRYKFYTCNRQPSESIADYVARLRALTEYCEFGGTLDSMLRDRLVCGVNNEQLQRRLLAEPRLTFERALELSRTFESATEDARHLQNETKSAVLPVNALSQDANKPALPQWLTSHVIDVVATIEQTCADLSKQLVTSATKEDTLQGYVITVRLSYHQTGRGNHLGAAHYTKFHKHTKLQKMI